MTDAASLGQLGEHVRRLRDCADERAVADCTVDTATALLPVDRAALYVTDEGGALRRLAAVGRPPAPTAAERAAESGAHVGDAEAETVAVPLDDGGGVLAVAGGDLDETALALLDLLAANAVTALERADRAPSARPPDRGAAASPAFLALVRDVCRDVVRLSTRAEIERVACERLAAFGDNTFVWFGDYRPTEGAVVPTTWAGVEDGYLDAREFPTDGSAFAGPVAERLLDDHEVVTLDRLDGDVLPPAVAERARARGYRSAAFLPVVNGGTVYGVVGVYATREHAFDEYARSVFAELAGLVALAVRAVEQKRAVMADTTTEVEFHLSDDDIALVELSSRADCDLFLDGLMLDADDRLRLFVSVADTTDEEFRAAVAETDAVSAARLLADHGDSLLFQVVTDRTPLAAYLAEQGIVLRSVSLSGGSGRAVAELRGGTDVRSVVDRVQSAYPETEFIAQRDRTEAPRSSNEFRALIEERLTDRQHEALQSAYHGGFYEWPREATGEDVAELLGIAQPTFLQHLRAAESKLLAAFFEDRRYVYSR